MSGKLNFIRVDIDIHDLNVALFTLIKDYIYARLKYGPEKVRVFLSSSRKGFRIEIAPVEVDILENLCERAIMDDDPARILFSLKRYAMERKADVVDIAFYYKKNNYTKEEGCVVELNMEELLGKDIIEKLENSYGSKIFEDIFNSIKDQLVEKIKKYIKPLKILYVVIEGSKLDEFAKELIGKDCRFKVYPDIWNIDKNWVVVRIFGSEETLQEIVNKYQNDIKKYVFIDDITK